MSTTIIILGALILIVIIAIVVVLFKGKSPKENNTGEESSMTFQEEAPQETTIEPQQDPVTPQLHQQVPTQQPMQNPPVLNDLNTPIQSVDQQPQPSVSAVNQSESPINQPNPLPDQAQMDNDMANLKSSMNEPNPAPVMPIPEAQVDETTTTVEIPSGDGIADVTSSINSQVDQQPIETTEMPQTPDIQIDKTSMPEVSPETTSMQSIDSMPTNTENTTTPVDQMIPMEQQTAAIDLDNPTIEESTPIPQPTTPTMQTDHAETPPIQDDGVMNTDIPTTPPPVTPM